MFEFLETEIPGCLRIVPPQSRDLRGRFVKILHEVEFQKRGLPTGFAEEFYTISRKSVLRGLHCQVPPHEHVKIVYCVAGSALDVVVDLRRGSPTYGRHLTFELSAENAEMIYIPPGLVHGFLVLSDQAIMVYKVGTVHSPESDRGIRWDSAGIAWPEGPKILSDRDLQLPPLRDFQSPFEYDARESGVRL